MPWSSDCERQWPLTSGSREALRRSESAQSPVLIGPLTYLHLGKSVDTGLDRLALLRPFAPRLLGDACPP